MKKGGSEKEEILRCAQDDRAKTVKTVRIFVCYLFPRLKPWATTISLKFNNIFNCSFHYRQIAKNNLF